MVKRKSTSGHTPKVMNGWISVEDELPKCSHDPDSFGVRVLVWPPLKMPGCADQAIAFYSFRITCCPGFYSGGAMIDGITHWQYLPNGPNGEKR